MIGAIGGDIAGSRFEGANAPPEGFTLFHPACRFTDDTVCTAAVADAMMRGVDMAATLRAFVCRHPDRGYGGMFLQWARQDGAPPYGSWGNGAPMRTTAAGWVATTADEAAALARAQAAVSHDHADAMAGAEAVARAIFQLATGEPADAVARHIEQRFQIDLAPERALARGGFDVSSAGTVPPALCAALTSADWEAAVRTAIGLGGDTDTLACIAGGVAEALHGVPASVTATIRTYLTPDLNEIVDRFNARRRAPA